LNSVVAERMMVVGSDADVSTAPAAVRNHPTLLSTQLVNVSKNPPTNVSVTEWVTQLSG
jgi:hypothetical protein